MAVARQRAQRRNALDISNCVGAAFGEKKVSWDEWLKTGKFVVWGRYPLPITPAVEAEVERLKAEERKRHAG